MKKILPLIIVILLILVIKNNVSSIIDLSNNNNDVSSLEKKLEKEKQKNKFLKERLTYVETSEFVENEAREKLGMLKEGEQFIIAPTPSPLNNGEINLDNRPNWQKWLELFF